MERQATWFWESRGRINEEKRVEKIKQPKIKIQIETNASKINKGVRNW